MTITQSPSNPLAVVVGVTGNQGGSVVRALAESDKPYRIRGLTRDVTKPAAREFAARGVEIASIALTTDNADAIGEVFKGADIVFVGHMVLSFTSSNAALRWSRIIGSISMSRG